MFAIDSFKDIKVYNLETGEHLFDINIEEPVPAHVPLSTNAIIEMSFDLKEVDVNPCLIETIKGDPFKHTFDLSYNRLVGYEQVKKHKKKRINKKWAKKYGYREVYIPTVHSLRECTITHVSKDVYQLSGTVEFP